MSLHTVGWLARAAARCTVLQDVTPFKAAFCHCESCRRAHSAPLYQVVYIPHAAFTVTKGASGITAFRKEGSNVTRAFCKVARGCCFWLGPAP